MPIVRLPDGKTVKFPDNMPQEEIIKALKSYRPEVNDAPHIPVEGGVFPEDELQGATAAELKQLGQKAAPYVRAGLEGLGMAGGGALGTMTGGPGGGVFGGAIGYEGGNAAADIYDQWVGLKPKEYETPLEGAMSGIEGLYKGLQYEAFGQAVGKGLEKLVGDVVIPIFKGAAKYKRAVPIFRPEAERRAGEMIFKNMTPAEATEQTAAGTASLMKEMPNLKLRLGQAEDDPRMMQFTRGVMRENPSMAEQMLRERAQHNSRVIYEYMMERFPDDKKYAETVVNAVNDLQESLLKNEEIATEKLERIAALAERFSDEPVIGSNLRALLETAKATEKQRVGTMWDALPNGRIGAKSLYKRLVDVEKETKNLPANKYPRKFLHNLLVATRPKKTTVSPAIFDIYPSLAKKTGPEEATIDLAWLREQASEAGKGIRDHAKAEDSNYRIYTQIKNALDATFDEMDDGSEAYKQAKAAYRAFKTKFRDGVVGEVLKPGGGGYKLVDTEAARVFFKKKTKEAAKELIETVGKEEARKLMRAEALADIYNTSGLYDHINGTINPKVYSRWLNNNYSTLKNYGILDEFKQYNKVAQDVLEATKASKEFQNSAFVKAFGKDPDKAVEKLFGGEQRYSTEKTAKEAKKILLQCKNNPAALEAFKNSFANFLFKKGQGVVAKGGGEVIPSYRQLYALMEAYEPAIRVLYNKSELDSLYVIRQALETISRGDDILGAGSTGLGASATEANRVFSGVVPFVFQKHSHWIGAKIFAELSMRFGVNQTKRMLLKAVFDPTYAKELVSKYITSAIETPAMSRGGRAIVGNTISAMGGLTAQQIDNRRR